MTNFAVMIPRAGWRRLGFFVFGKEEREEFTTEDTEEEYRVHGERKTRGERRDSVVLDRKSPPVHPAKPAGWGRGANCAKSGAPVIFQEVVHSI